MRTWTKLLLRCSRLVAVGLYSCLYADIIFVDVSATGSNTGLSWADAFEDLNPALETANAGDTIWVAQGDYYPGGDREDAFTLVDSVVILGGFSGMETQAGQRDPEIYPTVLSGNIGNPQVVEDNSIHVLFIPFDAEIGSQAVLDGFTISNGNADGDFAEGWGGGIYIGNGEPRIRNCKISDNRAVSGGGIHVGSASPVFQDVEVKNNYASVGGGGLNLGGTLYPRFIRCWFHENVTQRYGGAVAMDLSAAEFDGCVFSNNTAVEDQGGAISNYTNSHPRIFNCTFTGNTAESGGSLWSGGANALIVNSILWGNEPDEISGGFDIQVLYSNVSGGAGGEGNLDVDPDFRDPVSYDFRLDPSSPCIDAGIDLILADGDTLFYRDPGSYAGAAPDMGAFEHDIVTGLADKPVGEFELQLSNYPNPFNISTIIEFRLPQSAAVDLTILDQLGRTVYAGNRELLPRGKHSRLWNGHDRDGSELAAGLYFIHLQAGSSTEMRKILLVK